jgi:hypothetical protein
VLLQEKWQQKSVHKAQTEERLRLSLYGRTEELASFQCDPFSCPDSRNVSCTPTANAVSTL